MLAVQTMKRLVVHEHANCCFAVFQMILTTHHTRDEPGMIDRMLPTTCQAALAYATVCLARRTATCSGNELFRQQLVPATIPAKDKQFVIKD